MPIKTPVLWVVYHVVGPGPADATRAICEQAEWDALTAARPGHYALVRDRMTNEAEAERLARGTAGDKGRAGSGRPGRRASQPGAS